MTQNPNPDYVPVRADEATYTPEVQTSYVTEPPVPYTADVQTDQASTGDVAKDEVSNVKDTAAEAGQQVAGTAKDQASNVATEAAQQAKGLFEQAAGEVSSQAGTQQQRVAGVAHSFSKELDSMASNSTESGPLTDLASQASAKTGEVGHWLENNEPADLLREVQSFARRRPVAFLLGAAAAGVVVGRLTRGLAAEAKDAKEAKQSTQSPAQLDATYSRSQTPANTPASYAAPVSMVDEVPTQGESVAYGDADTIPGRNQATNTPFPVGTDRDDVIR